MPDINQRLRMGMPAETARDVVIFRNGEADRTISVLAPESWSDASVSIFANKYLSPGEDSVCDAIWRVAEPIIARLLDAYSASIDGYDTCVRLLSMLTGQRFSFNSPVWFNVGVREEPVVSACYILKVEDSIDSIADLLKTELLVYKSGAGSGSNLSAIRSSRDYLDSGTRAAGPLRFLRGHDAFAGVMHSGGKTRRAARMVILDDKHPDLLDFVASKGREERKASALIAAGYDRDFTAQDGAYDSVFYQNANHSVRISDEFVNALEGDEGWTLRDRNGEATSTHTAREIWDQICSEAYSSGDPGVQFSTTINDWHTCAADGEITGSNPCAEYLFLDNTSCNLGSFNLLAYATIGDRVEFDYVSFLYDVDVATKAMNALIDISGAPSPVLRQQTLAYRTIGIGYANLGALLVTMGIPYGSPASLSITSQITALLTLRAYKTSSELAQVRGPFPRYNENSGSMARVITKHVVAASQIDHGAASVVPATVIASLCSWLSSQAPLSGYYNAQVSVLAPTGTTALAMDCDTTGIEPLVALRYNKTMVGGSRVAYLPACVTAYLRSRGMTTEIEYVAAHGSLPSGVPDAVCDVLRTAIGSDQISTSDHLRIMAAAQPFLSGGISKTVNLPSTATKADISDVFLLGHALGLKCIAVYRDGCKQSQPLNTGSASSSARTATAPGAASRVVESDGYIRKYEIGGHKGYIIIGETKDGPHEVLLRAGRDGSTIGGLLGVIGHLASKLLQRGATYADLADILAGHVFEPHGFTGDPRIKSATSIPDFLASVLRERYGTDEAEPGEVRRTQTGTYHSCGGELIRAGTCMVCSQCGTTTGCS